MFQTVPLSITRSFSLYTHQWYMSYRFADSLWAESVLFWSSSRTVSKPIWHIPLLCVQWKTPDDGQRNCPKHVEFVYVSKPVWYIPLLCVQWKTPGDGQKNCLKHVEFYSKNKFEKSVHLVLLQECFLLLELQMKIMHIERSSQGLVPCALLRYMCAL